MSIVIFRHENALAHVDPLPLFRCQRSSVIARLTDADWAKNQLDETADIENA